MRLAVCIASRGTGHIRTIAGVIREVALAGVEPVWCWSFGRPIPDAQVEITRQALASDADAFWFVEDDQLLSTGVLSAMIGAAAPVVTVDYQGRHGRSLVERHPRTGAVVLTPMGCLLVQRDVFSRISDPPWQVDRSWVLEQGEWRETAAPSYAGGQDGHFSRECLRASIPILALDGWEVGHLDLVRAGGRTNYGMDTVQCYGGRGDLPWKPESREGPMAVEYWKSPSGHTVLPLDPNAGADIAFYERAGWVKVRVTEAAPIQKAMKARETEHLTRAADDTD